MIRLGLQLCTALSVALLITIKGDFMKIEEAIIHALDTSKNMDECKSCRDEHKQLAKCLQELKQIKDILGDDYDLSRLRELVEADRGGRCVVLPKEGTLKKGDNVWYVDRETGEIEGGTVFSSYYKNGMLDTFSVDFEDGDFDEFIGSAWGTCIFGSQKYAEAALIKGEEENK